MTKQDTRERILSVGAALVHRQGFRNTGLQDILDAAGVPKGSFYHYFRSKDDFGLALVEEAVDRISARAGQFLNDTDRPPLERLERFFDSFAPLFAELGFSCGCPIGNLMQEMADVSEPFRQRLGKALDAMIARIAEVLNEARQRDELAPGIAPDEAAAFILQAWQGTLIRMKIGKSDEALGVFKRMVFGALLRP